MKLKLTLLSVGFFFSLTLATAQHSPYYFYDTLKDDGVRTKEHFDNLGKIFMDVYPDYRGETDSSGLVTIATNASMSARVYLKRSLKYYYTKYIFDTTCTSSDWDYRKYKPKVKIPQYRDQRSTLAFFVCVLLCDTDTVTVWRMALWNKEFTTQTAFNIKLWNENATGTYEDYYFPLPDYVRRKKLTGSHEISMFVYPGKISCNGVRDRGPECIATGKFKVNISEDDLKKMFEIKYKSKKLDFPTCENDHSLINLEKIK